MADLTVFPGRLAGEVAAPPSKSLAHRALICAALARGESRAHPLFPSDDIRATIGGLRALGAQISIAGDEARVRGMTAVPEAWPVVDCLESGSTLRFLLPVALAAAGGATFLGRGRLGERPMRPYEEICARQGIAWQSEGGPALHLTVVGRLRPGAFELPGNVSSQFVTGLLLALPMLDGDSQIYLRGKVESAGYLDLTLDALSAFGVRAERRDANHYFVPGGQRYAPADCQVEGDWSQAAVLLCAGALGADVYVTGLRPDSRQGDRAALAMLRALGAQIEWRDGKVAARPGNLRGARLDAADCPDIVPIVALVAARAAGETRFVNAGRLRLKECDRLAATVEIINQLGGAARAEGDALVVDGVPTLRGGCICDCRGDHRMAMLLCVAALGAREKVTLRGARCVAKSYPNFFEEIARLGGKIDG